MLMAGDVVQMPIPDHRRYQVDAFACQELSRISLEDRDSSQRSSFVIASSAILMDVDSREPVARLRNDSSEAEGTSTIVLRSLHAAMLPVRCECKWLGSALMLIVHLIDSARNRCCLRQPNVQSTLAQPLCTHTSRGRPSGKHMSIQMVYLSSMTDCQDEASGSCPMQTDSWYRSTYSRLVCSFQFGFPRRLLVSM